MKRLGEKGIVLALALCAGMLFSGCNLSDVFNKGNASKVTTAAPAVETTATAVIEQADALATAVENSTGKNIKPETAEKLKDAADKVTAAANAANAVISAANDATGGNDYLTAFNAALIALGGIAVKLSGFFANRKKTATDGNVSTNNKKKEN
jgi:hypothetical protein